MDNKYEQINLVSNNTSVINALKQDPNLVNAWGIAKEDCTMWIADNATSLVTHYDLNGNILPEVINVNDGTGVTGTIYHPTGLLVNKSSGFVISASPFVMASSELIIATLEGTIVGYNPIVDTSNTELALVGASGSIFTGIAQNDDTLYVADFGNGKVLIVSALWSIDDTKFVDPNLPANYVPF